MSCNANSTVLLVWFVAIPIASAVCPQSHNAAVCSLPCTLSMFVHAQILALHVLITDKSQAITQYGSTVYIGMALVWPAL